MLLLENFLFSMIFFLLLLHYGQGKQTFTDTYNPCCTTWNIHLSFNFSFHWNFNYSRKVYLCTQVSKCRNLKHFVWFVVVRCYNFIENYGIDQCNNLYNAIYQVCNSAHHLTFCVIYELNILFNVSQDPSGSF